MAPEDNCVHNIVKNEGSGYLEKVKPVVDVEALVVFDVLLEVCKLNILLSVTHFI